MRLGLGNTLVNGGALNPDGLSLDLQFATDKTLTARKGPTPTFTRASSATYYGPLVDFSSLTAFTTTAISNGRASWFKSEAGEDITISYNGTRWRVHVLSGEFEIEYLAAVGSEWRPDQANWSGSGAPASVTTSSTFGIITAAINEPRFDHSTTAPNACLGLLIEEARTNLVFPSATLTTQTRTVTATAHTLSFYGTGTVVLSGVAIATVTGTGDFPTRTTLTFTPTAGSLIMTVTGTVQFAQLEAGSFPTSYIPTTTASVVRSGDLCSITGANFTGIYNQPEYTLFCEATSASHATAPSYISLDSNAGAEQGALAGFSAANRILARSVVNSITQAAVERAITLNQNNKMAGAFKANSFQVALNNVLGTEDTSGTMPTATNLKIGASWSNNQINGTIKQIKYFKKRLSNAKIQALTV